MLKMIAYGLRRTSRLTTTLTVVAVPLSDRASKLVAAAKGRSWAKLPSNHA